MKLLVCATVIILAFAAGDWPSLAVTAVSLLCLCVSARCGIGWMVGTIWPFRWLLFFTLLMHLFFSPGYTLFGIGWLSRDGLLHGALVCAQIAVAATAAALLNRVATAEETAGACGWALRPLSRFGCPVRQWEELAALALRFVPMMRDELQRTTAATGVGWQQRILAWEEHLLSLLDRLVDRADLLARRIANGEERILPEEPLPTLALCSGRNGPFAVGLIVTTALYAVAGRFFGG